MQMVRMVTTSGHVYAGRSLSEGDEFDCEPQHVNLMEILSRAKKKEAAQSYVTREMTAETPRRRNRQ